MKPTLSLGAILAVVCLAVAVPTAKDANLVNPVRFTTNSLQCWTAADSTIQASFG